MDPLKNITTVATPQSQPVPGKNQVVNNAGGYVFTISDDQRIERFLILGTWGGTYYVSEKELTKDNAEFLINYVNASEANATRLLEMIRSVSLGGRAHKQNPTLFALAVACSFGTPATKAAALKSVSNICRTGTMFFGFVSYLSQFRGRGRLVDQTLESWYLDRPDASLELQLVKYKSRGSWSHRDVLRLARPKPTRDTQANAFGWVTGKRTGETLDVAGLPMIAAFEQLKTETDINKVIELITSAQLPWEALPTQFLREPKVWEALLPHLGLTATLRNLGRMSNIGLVINNSEAAKLIVSKLTDPVNIAAQRVHPMQVLLALVTYKAGKGVKGDLTWTPVPRVLDALDTAFYLSFGNVEPTGARRMLAMDTSGSMATPFGGTFLRSCEATAAMAMVAVRTETEDVYTKHFSASGGRGGRWSGGVSGIGDLAFTPKTSLTEAIKLAQDQNWGSTDCALPMLWAAKNNVAIDSFEVYTDNETWAGTVHPFQALKQYRDKMGINAKLVVVATEATPFTIADPSDAGMMDVVGFDAAAPQAISYFIKN